MSEAQNSDNPIQKGMNRVIHDALRESIAGIELTFGPTLPSFKRDRFQTSSGREQSVAQFLESYFPSDWSVKKGPIFDIEGNASAEVDCVLCIPQHPPCRTPNRDIILADGVYAAVEVKPDITTLTENGELARSLKQANSVKQIKRKIKVSKVFSSHLESKPPEFHRIPYVVFSKDVSDPFKTVEFLDKMKEINSLNAWDLPDVIFGYRNWLIYHAPDVAICSINNYFNSHDCSSGEAYMVFHSGDDTIIYFLAILFSFILPRTQLNDFLLKDYLLPIKGVEVSVHKVIQ